MSRRHTTSLIADRTDAGRPCREGCARWLSSRTPALGLVLAAVMAVAGVWPVGGCSQQRTVRQSDYVAPPRDVPGFLRGTIGAETALRGTEPILVSGLGVVVGLNGTGGGEISPAIARTLEREMALKGIGKASEGALAGVTPEQLLRSRNVAVVIVEARLAPGAPKRSTFDVFVRTLPGSSVTSLEGGKLWTTDLRIGPAAVFSAQKTRKLAEAGGAVFINPFSDTGGGASLSTVEGSRVAMTRTVGRVLDGGVVTEPLMLEIVLDNPSHSRARSMVSAINTRFPEGPGDDGPTARGRAGDSIALRIPSSYRQNPGDFIETVRFLRADQTFADAAALQYVRALKEQPGFSRELMWCLVAIGESARKHIAELYDYPELAPRMAALEAGARLGDPRTVRPLIEIARSAPVTGMRLAAIDLLGRMNYNPNVNAELRELVDARELEIRVAAYEALSKLRDRALTRTVMAGTEPRQPKFVIEQVPSTTPMIYVTQQGEPRIALFGGRSTDADGRMRIEPLKLERPLLVAMWNDRLLMDAGSSGDIRLRFKDDRTGQTMETVVPETLPEFVQFLAHKPTPEDPRPGLNLSYSDVVGVLFELSRREAVAAAFATEEDRLRAQIFAAADNRIMSERPEDSERVEDMAVQVFRPVATPGGSTNDSKPSAADDFRSRIVPLTRPAKKSN
ncbi:MAG: flagellar basal body P-ring protein FlgI [Phycisphaeraceae bacterium]|nr:flagellar basal body P-ring protein FlgI [Phycisphaeraceae bacterium]